MIDERPLPYDKKEFEGYLVSKKYTYHRIEMSDQVVKIYDLSASCQEFEAESEYLNEHPVTTNLFMN